MPRALLNLKHLFTKLWIPTGYNPFPPKSGPLRSSVAALLCWQLWWYEKLLQISIRSFSHSTNIHWVSCMGHTLWNGQWDQDPHFTEGSLEAQWGEATFPGSGLSQALCRHVISVPQSEGRCRGVSSTGVSPTSAPQASLLFIGYFVLQRSHEHLLSAWPCAGWMGDHRLVGDGQTSRESMMWDQTLGHLLQLSFHTFDYSFCMYFLSTYCVPDT